MPRPADEGRHAPGPERNWEESFWFDFVADDDGLAGFVRLALWPRRAKAWSWAALVGEGRRYILVRDEDVPLPRGTTTEIRTEGLWSSLECEVPLDHWTVGLEAFGVALDDPADAWSGERGERIGLGFDLEWEAVAPAVDDKGGYRQACEVHGEILVGPSERLPFGGRGGRAHRWGRAEPFGVAPGVTEAGEVEEVRYRAPLMVGDRRVELVVAGRPGRWMVAAAPTRRR